VVLPDSGGLVLALVALSRFLLGLLVVEKEPPGGAARARGPAWQPQHAPPDPGAAARPGGARGGAAGGARGAAGGASEGAGAGAADAALAPPAMSQFFTVRARSRARPPGRVHAALRPACCWPPLAAGPAPPDVLDSTRAARLRTGLGSAASRALTRATTLMSARARARQVAEVAALRRASRVLALAGAMDQRAALERAAEAGRRRFVRGLVDEARAPRCTLQRARAPVLAAARTVLLGGHNSAALQR